MMDRVGSFAVVAALVLLSALHIVSAPNYLNIIPIMLLVAGVARILTNRNPNEAVSSDDLGLSPTAEA